RVHIPYLGKRVRRGGRVGEADHRPGFQMSDETVRPALTQEYLRGLAEKIEWTANDPSAPEGMVLELGVDVRKLRELVAIARARPFGFTSEMVTALSQVIDDAE